MSIDKCLSINQKQRNVKMVGRLFAKTEKESSGGGIVKNRWRTCGKTCNKTSILLLT